MFNVIMKDLFCQSTYHRFIQHTADKLFSSTQVKSKVFETL